MALYIALHTRNCGKFTAFGCILWKSINRAQWGVYVQCAGVIRVKLPPNYDDVELPETRQLQPFERGPPSIGFGTRPIKHMKDQFDFRGPELIHNMLQYGQYGVQALGGGNLRHGHMDVIRNIINRKMDESRMFAVWRVDQPWKSKTKKGIGVTMGGGKGNIHHYVTPVRANRILVEVGGRCQFEEVYKMLHQVAHIMPFPARAVSQGMLEQDAEREKQLEQRNVNPFTFEMCAKGNFLGCHAWLSPYDHYWHGKYR